MLKIEKLQKNYKSFSLDCSIELKPGRIAGLIGPNGSGKSTTFKAVLGLIRADGGRVELFGKNVSELSISDREKIGVALSDSGFSGYLCIKDILPVIQAMYKDFDRAYFDKYIKEFKLPMDKKIRTFSTGMKAKLKVLIALSHKAKLLILDEPTAGLDVIARDRILDIIREYMSLDDERAVLISSHISSDLETLCDEIYMINNGKIVLKEETDKLLDSYAILKLSEKQYELIDKEYLLAVRKESYGYRCMTGEKQFYMENYPEVVIEKGSIDELLKMHADEAADRI